MPLEQAHSGHFQIVSKLSNEQKKIFLWPIYTSQLVSTSSSSTFSRMTNQCVMIYVKIW